ncbi:MACPF domain-containing protein CAD1 [Salvia divinorum]|uniref:MACPF domain-containing protein CAD1 n=1 Tax=Salvia divinorum TaxID=28513 RepID=A0ABD1HV62_SALDI
MDGRNPTEQQQRRRLLRWSAGSNNALIATLNNSIPALGRGFDVTSDIRLLYCKGAPGSHLVHLGYAQTRNLEISESCVTPDVSVDIECSSGRSDNTKTTVWSFHELYTKLWYPHRYLYIENYVKDIGDQRFSYSKVTNAGTLKYKDEDVTIIFRRRGGDDLEQSYSKWARTVEGVAGIKHLARAIELYLEYKPPIEDLQYF